MKVFGGLSGKLSRGFLAALVFSMISALYSSAHAVSLGEIFTVAGGGIGDGGPATSVSLPFSEGVAVDSAGNIYIADTVNHRVRKVAAATGIITTVAGGGAPGFLGDGGPATSAALDGPSDVAVDRAGNLYIADGYRIRKVTAGIITTVAGNGRGDFSGDDGPATVASISWARGVSVDSSGAIYIADTGNQRIRKVAAGSGIITTVAGNGWSSFSGDGAPATWVSLNNPTSTAVDSAGNLYIADSANHRVRMVAAGSGIISTVAGKGTPAFTGDGGPAASAGLSYPKGVALDSAGNLYIADTNNDRIRMVAAGTGIISTVAGNGATLSSGDGGAAVSATLGRPYKVVVGSTGNIFILDGASRNRIRKVQSGTGIITTVAGNGREASDFVGDGGLAIAGSLNSPFGVAVDGADNLYIADSYNHRIRKVAARTGIVTTVAGDGQAGFSGDGGTATSARLDAPSAVALDSAGNLYVADTNNSRIRRVAAGTGIITTVADISGSGMAIDSAGNLFIASNQRIWKVAAGTGIITTVAGNGGYDFAGDGGPATSASLGILHGVAVDSAGNLFIPDRYNHRIRKVDAYSGIITTVAGDGTQNYGNGGPATSVALNAPVGVAVDKAGNLYFATKGTGQIRKVDAGTGFITTVAGDGSRYFKGDGGPATSAGLLEPHGVTLDSAGNLLIADTGNNRIRKVMMKRVAAPAVTTGAASSISATGATLTGAVEYFAADTTVTYYYGLTDGYGSSVSGGTVAAGGGKTAVNATVTDLACNSTYHFRAVAENSIGTYLGLDQVFTTAPCPILTVSILGSGGGSVNSDPAGVACVSGSSAGCSNSFTNGIPVTLSALPDWRSSFVGWGAPCSGTGNCTITPNANGGVSVSASFDVITRVRIPGRTRDYTFLQEAYYDAVSNDSLRAKVYAFTESLVLNRPIIVTIDGGWNDDFGRMVGTTTMLGTMTIQQGRATIRNLIVR